MLPLPPSLPGIADVTVVRGSAAPADAGPTLVIEVPHGATATADFDQLAAMLESPLPADLADFFHVNTDAGAPELADAVARTLVARGPARVVVVVRSRVPRTFIDCNRRLDATPEELRAGRISPGVMPWVTAAADRELLVARHAAYLATVQRALAALEPSGCLLMLHTYAPRSVDVQVGLDIVAKLRRAWSAAVEPTWPLRPPVDVIGRSPDGTTHAPPAVVSMLRAQLAPLELEVGESATYPLHPSTLAYEHALARPGRALCLEVRRDLLADPFDPFAEMRIGAARVVRLAGPIASALEVWWPGDTAESPEPPDTDLADPSEP
jgi:predicted N-formylglutamate amidohydrolase